MEMRGTSVIKSAAFGTAMLGLWCSPLSATEGDEKILSMPKTIIGVSPNHGDVATGRPDVPPPNQNCPVDPYFNTPIDERFRHYAILHFRLVTRNPGKKIQLRTKYAIFQHGNSLRKAKVDELVLSLINRRFSDSSDDDGDWNPGGGDPLPVERTDGRKLPTHKLHNKNFHFSMPARIYVVLHNDGLEFNNVWPILFTRFGSKSLDQAEQDMWVEMAKNKSFYNAGVGKVDGVNPYYRDRILYVENHYRDVNGCSMKPGEKDSLPEKNPEYSMNLNLKLRIAGAEGYMLPIVFDPDTGNGSGAPPPVEK